MYKKVFYWKGGGASTQHSAVRTMKDKIQESWRSMRSLVQCVHSILESQNHLRLYNGLADVVTS